MISKAALFCAKIPIGGLIKRTTATGTNQCNNKLERRKRPEFPDAVRLGFVPEEWFTFFYKKTGVTGPYALGVGALTYLCSKEIYVMEHEYYSGLSFAIMIGFGVNKLGPAMRKWADREIDTIEFEWNSGRIACIKALTDAIADEKKEQWCAEGALMLAEAKKENVAFQLEAAYRNRAIQAYNEVKNRLNYQVDVHQFQRRLAHKHMVNWIVSNVKTAIHSELEKDAFDRCISELGALAARVKAT